MYVRRLRAALVISFAYKRFKVEWCITVCKKRKIFLYCQRGFFSFLSSRLQVTSYFKKVVATFRNVKTGPQLGKRAFAAVFIVILAVARSFLSLVPGLEWPTPPKVLRPLQTYLQRIFKCWRSRLIIRRLPADKQAELRLKIAAYSVLFGKKRDWGFAHRFELYFVLLVFSTVTDFITDRWQGDYLSLPSLNPSASTYSAAISTLKQKQLFTKVYFSIMALKYNTRGKSTTRGLVLTEKLLLKLDPAKGFAANSNSQPLHLSDILAVTVPQKPEALIVVHTRGGSDSVCLLGFYYS
jgi:hypothetical protein